MAPARGGCDCRNLGGLFLRFSPSEKMAIWPPFWESLIRHPPADCESSWSETSSRATGRGAGGETAGPGIGQSMSGPTGPAPVLRILFFHACVLWCCSCGVVLSLGCGVVVKAGRLTCPCTFLICPVRRVGDTVKKPPGGRRSSTRTRNLLTGAILSVGPACESDAGVS